MDIDDPRRGWHQWRRRADRTLWWAKRCTHRTSAHYHPEPGTVVTFVCEAGDYLLRRHPLPAAGDLTWLGTIGEATLLAEYEYVGRGT